MYIMVLKYDMIQNMDFGSIKYNNNEYIIMNEPPYYDSQYKGHNKKEYYKAIAVKLGDIIDGDGFVTAYTLLWKLSNNNKPTTDICDWDNPTEITPSGCYQVIAEVL